MIPATTPRLKTLTAVALAASLACLASVPAQAGKIALGMTTWVGYGPLFLARDLGYFKEKGLDLDPKIIEDLYMPAVVAGTLQGAASTVDELLKYRSKDFCFKMVVALDESHGGDGVITQKDVPDLAALKGKQIAMNEGSTSEFWFNYLLRQNNLDRKDFDVVNLTADDAASAFIAGRVPAAVTWEPHLTFVKENDKGKVLINSAATPGVIVDVVALRCDVIEKQPEDVEALVSGLFRANDYIKQNPEKAAEIMAKGVGGYLKETKDFMDAEKGVVFYDKDKNVSYLGTTANPGPISKIIALGTDVWSKIGKIQMPIDYNTVVDPSFVEKAAK